ncbi:MAG TPA: 2'-5' RNA ligase family protein [Pyrinomonadaceae bacterium]|nr:2'-5' RNA ligase family protein [Pyrinomonadaceae bacterium]
MPYALIHYPAADLRLIDGLRSKYDPQFRLIAPHITIMFPAPDSIGERSLVAHIESVSHRWESFPIRLKGLQKSWDEYLFLLLNKGEEDVIRLHGEIYTGLLCEYCDEARPFIPHLTLGVFSGKNEEYSQALKEAEQLKLDYECAMDRLHLIKINDERSQIVWSKEFLLK